MSAVEPVELSVVITSYTDERLNDLFSLLDAIKAQTYQDFETILVVEGSEYLFRQIESRVAQIGLARARVIFNTGERGASASRNLGIRQAKGRIIGFIDDDACPFSDWAQEMLGSYESDTTIGVTGPAVPLWEDKHDTWFPKELHWIVSCTSWFECNEITPVRHVWFENASFRREAFAEAGYLDTTVGPHDSAQGFKQAEFQNGSIADDLELSLRVKAKTGRTIIYNPRVRVWHKVEKKRLKMSYIRRWSYWTGLSKAKLEKIHAEEDKSILAPERQLLKNIFTRLLPDIAKTFFRHPLTAWRKLSATVNVLLFVAIGYFRSRLSFRRTTNAGGQI